MLCFLLLCLQLKICEQLAPPELLGQARLPEVLGRFVTGLARGVGDNSAPNRYRGRLSAQKTSGCGRSMYKDSRFAMFLGDLLCNVSQTSNSARDQMLLWDFLPVRNLLWKSARFPLPASALLNTVVNDSCRNEPAKVCCGGLLFNGLGFSL